MEFFRVIFRREEETGATNIPEGERRERRGGREEEGIAEPM